MTLAFIPKVVYNPKHAYTQAERWPQFYSCFCTIGFFFCTEFKSRLTKSPAALQMNLTHFNSIHN